MLTNIDADSEKSYLSKNSDPAAAAADELRFTTYLSLI